MKPGDEKSVDVPAVKAFGLYNKELVQVVERTQLPDDLEIEVNEPLEVKLKDGQKIVARIADATDEKITLDANHPLAGENLIYDIKLVDII
jgi:peptidylprolyl isomerase